MIEVLTSRGASHAEAEAQVLQIIEGETDSEKAARAEAEAAAERRRLYEEQQHFMRISPMGLPGMGAKVKSGKRDG